MDTDVPDSPQCHLTREETKQYVKSTTKQSTIIERSAKGLFGPSLVTPPGGDHLLVS